jgi:hypothetical protein
MRLTSTLRLFAIAGAVAIGSLAAADEPPAAPSGDEILARACSATGLQSFSVPVHMDVRLHKFISFRAGVDGTAYYKAPGKSALEITKAPPIIGGFFKGQYNLDLLPAAWPAKYKVASVKSAVRRTIPVYELEATSNEPIGVNRVVFEVAQDGFAPLSVEWFYPNHSTISLSLQNKRVGNEWMPQTEIVTVSMPAYHLDATSTFGVYALNVPVADSVFVTR